MEDCAKCKRKDGRPAKGFGAAYFTPFVKEIKKARR